MLTVVALLIALSSLNSLASRATGYSFLDCIHQADLIVLAKVLSLADQDDQGLLNVEVTWTFKGKPRGKEVGVPGATRTQILIAERLFHSQRNFGHIEGPLKIESNGHYIFFLKDPSNAKNEYAMFDSHDGVILPSGPVNAEIDRQLRSPEATVIRFTRAAARGQTEDAQACFLPGGVDYVDIQKVLEAKPGSSRYEMKQMLESVDLDVAMPIVAKQPTEQGTKIIWRVTFKREFKPSKGPVFKPGTTYDFDATLKRPEDRWLIDNF